MAQTLGPSSPFTAGRFIVEVEKQLQGWILKAKGGNAKVDVVEHKTGGLISSLKHVSNATYNDMEVDCGFSMGGTFMDWINQTTQNNPVSKGGAIIYGDSKYNEVMRISFDDAYITKVTFPGCEANKAEVSKLTVAWKPRKTSITQVAGGNLKGRYTGTQKEFRTNNFRFDITGLEQGCKGLTKVDAITYEQTVTVSSIGSSIEPQSLIPAAVKVPDIKVTFGAPYLPQFLAYYVDFIQKGNSGANNEKTGTLHYLDTQANEEVATLNFTGMGMKELTLPDGDALGDAQAVCTATFYAETLEFKLNPKYSMNV